MSALRTRWEEEKQLVGEEMRRTVRFFHSKRMWWLEAAKKHEDDGNTGHAAYNRK